MLLKIIGIIGFVVLVVFFLNNYQNNLRKEFAKLEKGTSKTYILEKFGKPSETSICLDTTRLDGKIKKDYQDIDCKTIMIYKGIFLMRWQLSFDKNDKLIFNTIYVSE